MYYTYILKNQDDSPIVAGLVAEVRGQFTAMSFAREHAQERAIFHQMKCPIIEIYSHTWMKSDEKRLVERLALKYVPQWVTLEESHLTKV